MDRDKLKNLHDILSLLKEELKESEEMHKKKYETGLENNGHPQIHYTKKQTKKAWRKKVEEAEKLVVDEITSNFQFGASYINYKDQLGKVKSTINALKKWFSDILKRNRDNLLLMLVILILVVVFFKVSVAVNGSTEFYMLKNWEVMRDFAETHRDYATASELKARDEVLKDFLEDSGE